MSPLFSPQEAAPSGPAKGAWRPLLRTCLAGRAEPLYVDRQGLRSAASLWSGAGVGATAAQPA